MRCLFLLLLLLTSLPNYASAQSRVVDDTFREGRESYLQDSEDMREQFKQQGAVIMDERRVKAEEVDRDRIVNRELTDHAAEQWNNDWDNASIEREAAQARVQAEREAHRDELTPRPSQWWGLDNAADTGSDADIDGGFNP